MKTLSSIGFNEEALTPIKKYVGEVWKFHLNPFELSVFIVISCLIESNVLDAQNIIAVTNR